MPGTTTLTPRAIAEIAHELRSPLGGIEAMVEMLAASPLDADQARMIGALKASVAHLRAIADGVLGGDVHRPARTPSRPLDEVLAAFEQASAARACAAGLEFRLVVADDSVRSAVVTEAPLRQVLENLVDNAVRLTPAGLVELTASRQPGGRIGFRLVDSGPGLSAEEAARLIRDGGGIAGRTGGAGIGLTIAGRLVAEEGGTLTGGPAETGRGAAFAFDWPDLSIGQKGDCLIVDDHPASRLVMKTILGSVGYRCLEAGGVEEALALIAARPPRAVLTDINMPGGNGTLLIERIGGMPAALRPRLIVVSADEIQPDNPLQAWIDGAIRKPIAVRAVLEAMAKVTQADETRAA